jgi:hypothetical protein
MLKQPEILQSGKMSCKQGKKSKTNQKGYSIDWPGETWKLKTGKAGNLEFHWIRISSKSEDRHPCFGNKRANFDCRGTVLPIFI